MKASICLLLGVAVFSTLFLESSTASTGSDGVLGSVLGGVGSIVGGVGEVADNLLEAVKKLLAQLLGSVTKNVDKIIDSATNIGNGLDTLSNNATGATKDLVTKTETILTNLTETVAKIPAAIAGGTAESLDNASDLAEIAVGVLEQLQTILANPEFLKINVDADFNTVLESLVLLTKDIDQVKAQVSV